jgi:hypothetical protein
MLAAFGRMATMMAPQKRKPVADSIVGSFMQSGNPFDVATCMYYTGIDPFTKQHVYVARGLRDRKMQRALMQFFKPENWFTVREALLQAGRPELIGPGCDCLIPAQPPPEALRSRREAAIRVARGEYVHTIPKAPSRGYRPGRKSARRRSRRAGSR